MIERNHPKPSVGAQCQLLRVPRSSFCDTPPGETALNLDPMLKVDSQFLERVAFHQVHLTRRNPLWTPRSTASGR